MEDATALAALIRDGQVSAVSVMEASLSALQGRTGYGAVVYSDPEMALAGARAADATPKDLRGPFHGMPFLVKDLGGFARGLPAAAGSAAMRALATAPEKDNDLMGALRATGLVPFGLSATPPFGPSLSCEPEGLPPTRNPWNTALTSGGSSGGAAAAVASGIVAIAHATDAAGSIRVPAACCGLTGLKPSRGAVPAGPDFANHLIGIASELVLARSVRDVETAFRSVALPGRELSLPDKPRVAIALPGNTGPDERAALAAMGDALKDAGCTLCEIASPDAIGAEAHRIAWTVIAVSLAEWVATMEIPDDRLPPLAAALAAEARSIPGTQLFALTRDLARVSFEAAELFLDCQAVLMPVLSRAPVPVGTFDLSGRDPDDHRMRMGRFAPNVALANVAGFPALALPFGAANGLPLGGQLLGPIGSDAALLRLGSMIEARAPRLDFPHPIAGLPA
ncbi:MAG: amidase [Pseudomonadota bacterium]